MADIIAQIDGAIAALLSARAILQEASVPKNRAGRPKGSKARKGMSADGKARMAAAQSSLG